MVYEFNRAGKESRVHEEANSVNTYLIITSIEV
jgi:hypothetical protein